MVTNRYKNSNQKSLVVIWKTLLMIISVSTHERMNCYGINICKENPTLKEISNKTCISVAMHSLCKQVSGNSSERHLSK